MKNYYSILFYFLSFSVFAQVGIGTTSPNESAILEVVSSDKGVILPRVALTGVTDILTIANPTPGLLIYNTANVLGLNIGYTYWNGSRWSTFLDLNTESDDWKLEGNALSGTEFLGSTNNRALSFKVNDDLVGSFETDNSFHLGSGSNSANDNAVALGVASRALSENAVALGNGATAKDFTNTIAIGTGALAAGGINSIAIGNTSKGLNANGIAIGFDAETRLAEKNIAIGFNSTSTSSNSVVLGTDANTNSTNGIAIGNSSYAKDFDNTIAIGNSSFADKLNTVAMGNDARATGIESVAIGMTSRASAEAAIAFGQESTASGANSVAIGDASTASSSQATALGSNSQASGARSTAAGFESKALGDDSAAYGRSATARFARSTATGFSAEASNKDASAYGSRATASGVNSLALGSDVNATGSSAVAIGINANASNQNSLAIGVGANASASNATALGAGATASQANTVILGNNANVGIGTNNPTAKLQVNGNLRYVDSNQAAGKILKSDTNGNASWEVLSSNKAYGEIYRTSNLAPTADNTNQIITGMTWDTNTLSNVTPVVNYLQVDKTGVYKVTFAVSIFSTTAADRNFDFYIAKGTATTSSAILNKSRSYVGNSDSNTYLNTSKTFMIYLVSGERLYLGYRTSGDETTLLANTISLAVESMNF